MNSQTQRQRGAILAAACALPGVTLAESAPTEGLIGWKLLYYREARDWVGVIGPNAPDPTKDPLTVVAPSVFALMPIGSRASIEGGIVYDKVSGATPRAHSSVSGASSMEEERLAVDLKGTFYFRRAAVGVAFTHSGENDYKSNALAVDTRLASDDNNTTLAFGLGHSRDEISASDEKSPTVNALVNGKKKNVSDSLIGVTQVLSPADVIKANLTYSRGRGFFGDPYKNSQPDRRPDEKNSFAILLQWNHHFAGADSTLRSSYRYYQDSYKVTAHTFGFEYAKPFGSGWQVTPGFRYYTQSKADFYFDPDYTDTSGLPNVTNAKYYSFDYRLSAFGGITLGAKIAKRWGPNTVDFRYDYYYQSPSLRLLEEGSPNIADFRAHMLQLGYSRRF